MKTSWRTLTLLAAITSSGCPEAGSSPPAPPSSASASGAASAPSASAAASADVQGPAADLLRHTLRTSQAFETVASLTTEVGARLAGSAGAEAAVAWGVRTLGEKGLSNVHTEAVMAPHWERGEESGEIVAPYPHRLALAALGGSAGTAPEGLEAEVVRVESLDAVDALPEGAVRGKIVFFDVVMERARDGSGYGKAVRVRGAGASRAAKYGAVGVVIRSIGTDHNRLPHTGAMRYDEAQPKIPAAALSIPDADTLARTLASGKKTTLRMRLGAKWLPDAPGANVVGEVVGSEAPGEIVLLGAHLDSWDLGTGAIDDGAGCAIVIEAARQIAALAKKPRRTVRVVLFANEENGLAGGKAYAKAHEAEIGKHVVGLEADLGAGRVYEARLRGGEGAAPVFARAVAALAILGVRAAEGEAEGGADISPLRAAGMPLVDLRQDATTYFDLHHTANDTLDKIEKADLDQVAAAYASVAYSLANDPSDLGRAPPEEEGAHK